MLLADVAKWADNTVAADAYNPATTLRLQLSPLDLYKIDGTAVRRRQASAAPAVNMPARRTLNIDGEIFLVGESSPDMWMGSRIRNNYVLQGADFLADIYTVAQALANSSPSQAWAALNFNKNMTDERANSDYHSQYNIYFANGEMLLAGNLIHADNRWFLVRQAYTSVSGLVVTLANQIDDPVFETVTFASRTYVPATDGYTQSTSSVKVMRLRWAEWFDYLSMGTEKFQSGDMQVFILKSAATPKSGDTLTLSDGAWQVLNAVDDGLIWTCHVRRH